MNSAPEKVKIIEIYEAANSVAARQLKFCQRYNVCHLPSFKTIKHIVVKFKIKDSVLNQQKGASRRH